MGASLKHKVVSGMKWLALSKLLIQLFRWGATFWVIRQLSAYDYGVMAIAEVMTSLLLSINFLCIGNAIIRFDDLERDQVNTLSSMCILIGVVLCLFQLTFASFFSGFYQTPEAEGVLKVLAVTFLIEVLSVQPMAFLSKEMQFKKLAMIDLVAGILMPISVLICAYNGMGYWSLAIGHLVMCSSRAFMANYVRPARLQLGFSLSKVSEVLAFGMRNMFASILGQLNSSLDIFIGGYYLSTQKIGAYQVGLQVSLIPLRKISPELRRISLPAFSQVKYELDKVKSYLGKVLRLISVFVIPLCWGLSMVADSLVYVALTDKWMESAEVIQIICIALPFRLLTEVSRSMLNALGRADLVLENAWISIVLFTVCIFSFVSFEVVGLAIAWTLSSLLAYIILLTRISTVLGARLGWMLKQHAFGFFASLLMALSIFTYDVFLGQLGLLDLLVKICLGGLIYISYLWLFNRVVFDEVKSVFRR